MSGSPVEAMPAKLANLVIAGVGKSGTSSLFAYLSQHPEICGSDVKETHYFSPLRDGQPLAPIAEYAAHFAHCRGEPYRLEATPGYCLGGERVIRALQDTLDHPRVIILLRDPVDRLWDNFHYMKSKLRARDVDTFDEYVERCLALREQGLDSVVESGRSGWSRSFYGDFMGPWLEAFGDDLRIVFFEHFIADPAATVADLCTWLQIDRRVAEGLDYEVHNRTVDHRSPGLQQLALGIRARGDGFLRRHPGMATRLRRSYLALNGREQVARTIHPSTRARLEEALAPSTRRVAELLREHGYTRFAPWLEVHDQAWSSDPTGGQP